MPETPCRHHWIIAPGVGLTSTGVCQKCGAVREFNNVYQEPDVSWKTTQRRGKPKKEEESHE